MARKPEDRLAPLRRALKLEEGEARTVAWSSTFFFCVLCSYFILRPIRETFGIEGGTGKLPWLFTGTFIGMLVAVPIYSAVVARFPRRVFLPWVYVFFALSLLIFVGLRHMPDPWTYFAADPVALPMLLSEALGGSVNPESWLDFAVYRMAPQAWNQIIGGSFFIALSVFNLFAVSVLYSLMAEVFTSSQGKRVYGIIAAGGTVGALSGSFLTARLVGYVGYDALFLLAILLFAASAFCVKRIIHHSQTLPESAGRDLARGQDKAIGGGIFAGFTLTFKSPFLMGICGYMFLSTLVSTVVYFTQAEVVNAIIEDRRERTELFGYIDFIVQSLTLIVEILFTSRIMMRLGIGVTLATLPVLFILGFTSIGLYPTLSVVVVFQVLRRSTRYAVAKPAKEWLFTLVSPEEKYKCKSFIDTVVYRGGDATSGWLFSAAHESLSLSAISYATIPVAFVWLFLALFLGKQQRDVSARSDERNPLI